MKQPSDTATVYDLNATAIDRDGKPVARSHDVIIGRDGDDVQIKTYHLSSQKGTKMPLDHAMKFLHPGFRVVDGDGVVIKPVEKRERIVAPQQLRPDELVAGVEELSDESLFKRAKVLPLSDGITLESSRQEMIDFIVSTNRATDAPGQGAQGSNVPKEMSQGELDRLLGDKV